jgi:hypothetical protein
LTRWPMSGCMGKPVSGLSICGKPKSPDFSVS